MAVLDAIVEKRAREAVQALSRLAVVRAAYVFGSRAEGQGGRFSDIDLAAFIDEAEKWDIRRRAQIAAQVQKEAGDEVELHLFRSSDLVSPPPASFAGYVKKKGVLIQ